MRVITFSTKFPKKHPIEGEETDFVAKIWKGLKIGGEYTIWSKYPRLMKDGKWQVPHIWRDMMLDKKFSPKYHTIRAGNRWKVGDYFSPRIWSGKPYASKQIQFAPPIEIKLLQKIELEITEDYHCVLIDDKPYVEWNNRLHTNTGQLDTLAKNDGLATTDFINWFKKPFVGQIICWNENINY